MSPPGTCFCLRVLSFNSWMRLHRLHLGIQKSITKETAQGRLTSSNSNTWASNDDGLSRLWIPCPEPPNSKKRSRLAVASDPSHSCPQHLVQSTREDGVNAWAVLRGDWGTCRLLRDDLRLFHKDRLLQITAMTMCFQRGVTAIHRPSLPPSSCQPEHGSTSGKAVTCPCHSTAPHLECEFTAAPVLTQSP